MTPTTFNSCGFASPNVPASAADYVLQAIRSEQAIESGRTGEHRGRSKEILVRPLATNPGVNVESGQSVRYSLNPYMRLGYSGRSKSVGPARMSHNGQTPARRTRPVGARLWRWHVTMEISERLLTPGEVALMFRVDPKTVTRWASAGRIGSIRTPGGHRQVPRVGSERPARRSDRGRIAFDRLIAGSRAPGHAGPSAAGCAASAAHPGRSRSRNSHRPRVSHRPRYHCPMPFPPDPGRVNSPGIGPVARPGMCVL